VYRAPKENFPVLKVEEERWSGDRLDFRVRAIGQIAVGNVQVADDNVRLEVTLPWLLQKFGEEVQKTIQGRGRILPRQRSERALARAQGGRLTSGQRISELPP
jgi:hypothetical protein